MSNPKGRFCWYELVTTDRNGAVSFYTKVAGWGTMDWQAPDASLPPYTMWQNGEAMLGGVMGLPEEVKANGATPTWVIFIATPDIEATVKRAKRLGGTVRKPPTVIPTVGSFAELTDPQGAAFSVFQSDNEAPGHDGPRQVGEFSWHELATPDPDAAFEFYSDLFGWVKGSAVDMGELGPYQMFGKTTDLPIGGIYRKPDEIPVPGWLPYIRVDDVHKAVKRVRSGGGSITHAPSEVPGGDLVAQGVDPQGATFALHSRAS